MRARDRQVTSGSCRAHEGSRRSGERQPLRDDRAAGAATRTRVLAWDAGRRGAAPRGGGRDPRPRRARARSRRSSRSTPAPVTGWARRTDIQPMAVVVGADGGRGARAAATPSSGRDGAPRRHRPRRGAGRRLAGRPLRPGPRRPASGCAAAVAFVKPHAGRQRVGAPGRRRDRAARPEHARGAARRRPRRRADPARERQLRRRRGRAACATTSRRSRSRSPTGPDSRSTGRVLALAALAAARRLHAARGPGAEPRRLRGRRPAALDPVSRVAVGDGRALRRSQPDALLQERLRRRRERRRRWPPRRSRAAATASARSSTSTPSCPTPTARRCTIPNAICIHEEDVGRAVAPHRVARRLGRGAPLAAAGDLVVLGHRQLRLRLLLVPVPGRHDRVRGEADRRALDRRRGARRAARARHAGRSGAERDGAPALLQHAPRPGRRRPARTASTRCGRSRSRPGAGNPYGNAFRPRRRRLATELAGPAHRRRARRRAGGRSSTPHVLHRLGRADRLPPGAGRDDVRRSRSRMPP